jgi:8-oxo-dGTP pyrophosphatase MutT (NUDIX family)
MGIILFRRVPRLQFLMVCRKDSYGYVEFIRGKYSKFNMSVISTVVSEMTIKELNDVMTKSFEELWKELWMETEIPTSTDLYNRNFETAQRKFNDLRRGYMVNGQFVSLPLLVAQYGRNWREPEWGFPKGRRNGNETDLETATREFMEETGYQQNEFEILNSPPLFEIFFGSNRLRYKHIYYLAELKTDRVPTLNANNPNQVTEISQLGFFDYDECMKRKIRFYLTEKKKVLERAYRTILATQ